MLKIITIIVIVDLPPISLTAKKIKMFPKKCNCYHLINDITGSIIIMYWLE